MQFCMSFTATPVKPGALVILPCKPLTMHPWGAPACAPHEGGHIGPPLQPIGLSEKPFGKRYTPYLQVGARDPAAQAFLDSM
jgi:hypothetical protein